MESKLYAFLIFLAGSLVGVIVGGYGGSYLAASAVINNWVNSQTKDGRAEVDILRQLRTGQQEQAIEMLESELDRDIVSLLPEYYEKFRIQGLTLTSINETLLQAKHYRLEYPRQSKGMLIDHDVTRAFTLVD